MVGDGLLGEQEAVGAADAAAQLRGVERAAQGARQLGRIGHHGRRAVEPADDGRQVAGVHVGGDGQEGQVRIGEPHERERLAGGHGARAVAAVEHGAPAAALQRGGELVGAVGVLDPQPPAGLLHRAQDDPPVCRGNVDEQRA